MSTALHPQIDRQTERLNQTIKSYLRAFVSREKDNWVSLLPMAEFVYNNSVTTGNGMIPFYANYGFHPTVVNPPSMKPLNPASTLYTHWMQMVHDGVVEEGCRLHKTECADTPARTERNLLHTK